MEEFLADIQFLPISQNQNTNSDLPINSYVNPKIIFTEYLQNIFKGIKLKSEIMISTAYPSEAYFSAFRINDGSNQLDFKYKRGINIGLENQKTRRFIGNVLRNEVYGFLEDFSASFYVWSFDPLDRDVLGDFVLRILFEAQESKYLLKKGIPDFNLESYKDYQDEKLILNHPIFYRQIFTNGKRFVFGKKIIREIQNVIIQDVQPQGIPMQEDCEIETVITNSGNIEEICLTPIPRFFE